MPATVSVPILRSVSDPHELLQAGRFEELAHDEHPLWRGLALLELGRFPEAARVFEEAEGAQESGTMLEFAGAARWLASSCTSNKPSRYEPSASRFGRAVVSTSASRA